MNQPRLYEWYDPQQAAAFFGDEAAAQSLCNGQWLLFGDVAVCLTAVGEPPTTSHFANGSSFFWVADQPYRLHDDRISHFLPAQLIGSKAPIRSTHQFVRPASSKKYLYVGELGPSHMQQAPGPQNHGMAQFDLRPTLPSGVWAQLGGLRRTDDADATSVDRALDRLRVSAVTVEDRLEALHQLVEYWHGPIRPEDGVPEQDLAPLRLPRPLKWWYGWAGLRTTIMSGQNHLLAPNVGSRPGAEVCEEDDRLLFYLENQAAYRWATLFDGDDPPVFGRCDTGDPWQPEGVTLAEHLILACIFEAVTCHSPYGASAACLEGRTLSHIEQVITPIAIAPWRWLGPTRFYAKNGAFMYAMGNGRNVYSVWIGAETEQPLQFLKPYLDDAWEYTAV